MKPVIQVFWKIILIVLGLVAAATLHAAAYADGKSDSAILDTMQAEYDKIDGLRAAFTQRLTKADTGESEERTGTVMFRKPMLVRWETETPETELLVVGSEDAWTYFPEEETAYRYPIDSIMNSKAVIRLLSGHGRIDEDFFVEKETEEGELVRLDLIARDPEPSLMDAVVWVNRESGLIKRVILRDFYQNENDVTFGTIRRNPDLPDSLFNFTPPEGIDVFEGGQ